MAAGLKNSVGVPLVVIVGLTWAASFVSGVLTHDYTPLGITTPVMLVVTGAVLARAGNGNNKGNGNGKWRL